MRYVTRASERFDLRNRLYQKMVGLLRDQSAVDAGLAQADQPEGSKADDSVMPDVIQ